VTDKETDGQTHDDSIYRASTASRGKDDGSGDGSGDSGISQTFVRPSSTCRTSLLVGSKNIAGNSIAPGSTYERRQFHDKNASICESAVQQHTSANHCTEELLVLSHERTSPSEDYFVLYRCAQGRITLQCTHNTKIRHKNKAILGCLAH